MKKNKHKTTVVESEKNYSKFKPISDYIGEHYVGDPVDKPLTNEERNVISMFSAMDMYIGSEYTKKQFIATGMVIGIISTIVTIKIINKIKKKES